ncbi:MAG: rod shape-determining protein MreC, partial [Dissulfurispiraceae bacterium]
MSKGKKRFIIFFSLSLIALIVMTLQHNRRPFQFLNTLSYPFDVLNGFTKSIRMTSQHLLNTFVENKKLKEEIAKMLLDQQRFGEVLQENKRLREILSIKAQTPNYVTAAEAVARGYDRLLNTIIIDKGKVDGIEKDMTVITSRGLIGKIYSVENDFSTVLLLTDPNFSVSVRLQKSRTEGVLSGTGYEYCLLKYISFETPVENGEVLITSGLDGLFPPGLRV